MKNLFSDLKASIYSSDFVSRFRTRSVERASFFLLILCSLSGIVATVVLFVVMIPALWFFFNSNLVADYYPEGLEVQITNGQVSTNVENPYILPVSYFSNELLEEGDPQNLLVIDTTTTDPLTALETYDTMILVSGDKVVAQKSDGEVRVFSLEEVENLTITEQSTQEFVALILPWLIGGVVVVCLFIPVIIVLFMFIYNLAVVALLALVVWLLGKLRKLQLTYKESFVLSIYTLTLPFVVSMVNTAFFNIDAPVFLLAFLAVILVNVRVKKVQTVGE